MDTKTYSEEEIFRHQQLCDEILQDDNVPDPHEQKTIKIIDQLRAQFKERDELLRECEPWINDHLTTLNIQGFEIQQKGGGAAFNAVWKPKIETGSALLQKLRSVT